jgi:hypothetical protein
MVLNIKAMPLRAWISLEKDENRDSTASSSYENKTVYR